MLLGRKGKILVHVRSLKVAEIFENGDMNCKWCIGIFPNPVFIVKSYEIDNKTSWKFGVRF